MAKIAAGIGFAAGIAAKIVQLLSVGSDTLKTSCHQMDTDGSGISC